MLSSPKKESESMPTNYFLEFTINLNTFQNDLKERLLRNKETIKKLKTIENKTYKNFIKPLSMLDEHLNQFFTPLSHVNNVNNSQKTQEIYAACIPLITAYSTKLSQDIDIYKSMKNILSNQKLSDEQKRVLQLDILSFELNGAHLDEITKQRLQKIHIKIEELSNDFSQNLLDATNDYEYIITDKNDLKNLPQSDIDDIKFKDNGVVKYKLNLQAPTYISYMTYGANQEIRQKLYKAYTTRAPQNQEIIDQLLKLKFEMANLLGFDNYTDFSLASKMAPSANEVIKFLQKLITSSTQQAKQELKELQYISNKKLNSYDLAYFSELLKQKQYDINQEEYRPYFEQNMVIDGLFNFLNKLFELSFKKIKAKAWHKDVAIYNVYLKNKLISRIYLDLQSRKTKRDGAWMHNWQTHYLDENSHEQLASAFIVCNFPPSSSTTPSLLRHDDVVTLFHEMGHAIHHMLSKVNENSISGVNGVEWDAVEYPSQFLENFAYEAKVLKIFAKHYQTKEILPDNMINKLIKAKNFQSALSMLRQLEFSLFDFKIHSKLYQDNEIQQLLDGIRETTALIKPPKYNKFQHGFAHIFAGGYSAGYYSYKWAEVLSADTFFRIIDEGLFNSQIAKDYLDIILQKGGSYSMYELFQQLMKREPDVDALLRLNDIN